MSWLRRGQSLLRQSVSANRLADLDRPLSPYGHIDKQAALDGFRSHWQQAYEIMKTKRSPKPRAKDEESGQPLTADDVTTIVSHIDQMITLLIQESQGMTTSGESESISSTAPPAANTNGSNNDSYMISPLLDFLYMELILDKLLEWSIESAGEFTNTMKLQQLKFYELLVSQLCQKALFQKPLVRPMLQLLATCGDCAPVEVEKRLVILLNSLCVSLSQNPQLLELFFMPKKHGNGYLTPTMNCSNNSSPVLRAKIATIDANPEARFLIFSLLIPFVHREGPIGQQARDALLLIMSLSRKHDSVGVYIAENSNFCPVLATGLSGLYSSLPRKLPNETIAPEDWQRLTADDIEDMVELQLFLNSLEFCNAVVQVAHPLVQKQLLEYVYQGFLVSVIGPALHQDTMNITLETLEKSPKYVNTLEEIIATTAYFELFLRTISEPALIQVFLKFMCTETFDGQPIMNTLIARINGSSKLNLVTLVLFRTTLELNCEDVMLELIFQHLLPCKFLKEREKQIKRIDDNSALYESAETFLNFMPTCCYYSTLTNAPLIPVPGHFNLDSFDSCTSNVSRNSSVDSLGDSLSSSAPLINHYLEYLNSARDTIYINAFATQAWSRLYNSAAIQKHCETENEQNQTNCADSGIFMNNSSNNNVPTALNGSSPSSPQVPCSSPSSGSSPVADAAPASNLSNDVLQEFDQNLIGPFLHTLLVRLENMTSHDFYSNLQLTAIISYLASYSQPLLRSFLLNNRLIFRANAKCLRNVLNNLQRKIDILSNEIAKFDELRYRAKMFLKAREERLHPPLLHKVEQPSKYSLNVRRESTISNNSAELVLNINHPAKESRRKSFKELFGFRGRTSSTMVDKQLKPVLESVNSGYRYNKPGYFDEAIDANEFNQLISNQRAVLASLVFEEFLKEMSAISQEHYVYEKKQQALH